MIFNPFTITLVVTLALLAIVHAVWMESKAQPERAEIPEEFVERLKELDRNAVDAAYSQFMSTQFLTWMKDEIDQPERALRGGQRAKKAYVDSMRAIDRR